MSEYLPLIAAVLIVVATSATCSLFEAVLYSVPVSHIEALVHSNKRAGRLLRKLRERVDEPITAILSLNTIANTAGASVAGAMAARVLGVDSIIYFSIVFTFLILFFAEVIPKTIGVAYARPVSPFVAAPIRVLVILFYPLIRATGLVTRLIAGQRGSESISPEELVLMAKLGLRSGALDKREVAVIQNILALDTKVARDIVTPRTVLFALKVDQTVGDVWRDKGVWPHSRAPVYGRDLDDVLGLVHRPDLLAAVAQDRLDMPLRDLMKPIVFVPETVRLDKLLQRFLRRGQHMVGVVDEFGGLAGVVTLEDVLEEILGQEIVDEFDEVADMQELARKRRESTLREWTALESETRDEDAGDGTNVGV